jgi:hypothetical protein
MVLAMLALAAACGPASSRRGMTAMQAVEAGFAEPALAGPQRRCARVSDSSSPTGR